MDSIAAYDLPRRIESYDADMDVMHPNRHKMVEVALELLPFERQSPFLAIDLGVGTGFFSHRFLETFPSARVIAIDGARSMIETATERLRSHLDRVDFRVGDFRHLDRILKSRERAQVVLSSYALHHLNPKEKASTIRRVVAHLEPGGWFLNADLLRNPAEPLETRIQQLRVAGILRRAAADDPRFSDRAQAQAFLDDLEQNEGDQPLSLERDLEILRTVGLGHTGAFWLEHREAVTGGVK